VTRFLQQRVNSTDAINRHAAVFATQAGSLGYITPLLNESMEPLLQKLQRQMVVAQPQPAGLNPAAFRCTCFSDDVQNCLQVVSSDTKHAVHKCDFACCCTQAPCHWQDMMAIT